MRIKVGNGLNLTFAGAPRQAIRVGAPVRTVALLGADTPHLRPLMRVEPGDAVAAGTPLFADRKHPEMLFVSPAAGRVADILRGARRGLDTLTIAIEGDAALDFALPQALTRESLVALLLQAGCWPAFRTRPFGHIPPLGATPEAIVLVALDTRPLAADPTVVIPAYVEWFERGARALRLLGDKVYLCRAEGADIAGIEGIETVDVAGSHPAGLASTLIHHLHPVGHGGSAWHIGYQDIIAIGHLLATGRLWGERVVALGGAALGEPGLVVTRPGADLRDLTRGLLTEAGAQLLSGSPLDGRLQHHLGRYHLQVTARPHQLPAPAGNGWWHRLKVLAGRSPPALIPNAAHERVAPIGILPIPFLRALEIGDLETARRLGALELVEEDMALLTHVDGGRTDYGALLRAMLDELEAEQ